MSPLLALAVFLAAIATDVTWAKWAHHVAQKDAALAALWGVGIVVIGAVAIAAISDSILYAVPEAAGAALGTYLAVSHSARHQG